MAPMAWPPVSEFAEIKPATVGRASDRHWPVPAGQFTAKSTPTAAAMIKGMTMSGGVQRICTLRAP